MDPIGASGTLDTECYLRETETVVAAMQERVTRAQRAPHPSSAPQAPTGGPVPPRTKRNKPDGPAGRLSSAASSSSHQRASSLSRGDTGRRSELMTASMVGPCDRGKAESPREKTGSESTGSVRSELSSVGSSGDTSEAGLDNSASTASSIRKNRAFSR